MTLGSPYHVGIVVPDLEAAIADQTAAFGHEWSMVRDRSRPVTTADGTTDVRLKVVFSVEGPAHVELIESAPGTPWETCGLHHYGYWSDDVRSESDRLVELGMPRVLTIDLEEPGGPWRVAYHLSLAGPGYVELVASSVRPEFEARVARTIA